MRNISGKLKNKVYLWGRKEIEDRLKCKDYIDDEIKSMFADIIPVYSNRKNKSGEANTKYSDTDFKFRVRKKSFKGFNDTNWFIHESKRYDIKYSIPDFNNSEYMDVYCELITE